MTFWVKNVPFLKMMILAITKNSEFRHSNRKSRSYLCHNVRIMEILISKSDLRIFRRYFSRGSSKIFEKYFRYFVGIFICVHSKITNNLRFRNIGVFMQKTGFLGKNDELKSDQIQRNFSIEDFNRLEQRLQPEKTGLFEVYQTPGQIKFLFL